MGKLHICYRSKCSFSSPVPDSWQPCTKSNHRAANFSWSICSSQWTLDRTSLWLRRQIFPSSFGSLSSKYFSDAFSASNFLRRLFSTVWQASLPRSPLQTPGTISAFSSGLKSTTMMGLLVATVANNRHHRLLLRDLWQNLFRQLKWIIEFNEVYIAVPQALNVNPLNNKA